MNTELMEQGANTGSKNKKIELLAGCDDLDKKMLCWALDPAITFGVIMDTDEVVKGWMGQWGLSHRQWWDEFNDILGQLSRRDLTGNAAIDAVTEHITDAMYQEDALWACRIVNRDLRAGFSESTLNKVFPGIIEPFEVALCKVYDPEKHDFPGSWIIEPKLDGLRMVIVDGVAYTRNGRTIETVGHIQKELAHLTKDYVFDGEVMGVGEFDEASGDIRRKSTGENKDIYYNVFDVVPIRDWLAKKTEPLRKRKEQLKKIFHALVKYQHVRVVEWLDVPTNPTSQQIFAVMNQMIARGYEGAVAKDLDQIMVWGKHTGSYLKIKKMDNADGRVKQLLEGKGKDKGKLGAMMVEFDGVITKVGSGFSDAQRREYWKLGDEILEEMIEAQYQNKTPDGKLRFPVFIKFRKDKT